MHNLNEDVEKAMATLSQLSSRAKRLGSDDAFYAANRELDKLNRRAAPGASDADQ